MSLTLVFSFFSWCHGCRWIRAGVQHHSQFPHDSGGVQLLHGEGRPPPPLSVGGAEAIAVARL